ncbi:MAG: class I SAM-dependent methyltransferase [Acidimicrobiales bacterium]
MLTERPAYDASGATIDAAAATNLGANVAGPPAPSAASRQAVEGRTLERSVRLLRAFRQEQTDPDLFYEAIAADAAALLGRRIALEGARVLDIGCGAGYLGKAFRERGSVCFMVDPDCAELSWRGAAPEGAVLGDGYQLPFRSGSSDLVVSSNMLEHVARPFEVIDEMARVVRPGGHVWISFTNWYGPWGGHETAPWHYLGADRAAQRYERRRGRPPKNRLGETMFAIHVGPTLRYLSCHPALEVVDALPRYHPSLARGIVRLPGVRELMTWNLEVLARRQDRRP